MAGVKQKKNTAHAADNPAALFPDEAAHLDEIKQQLGAALQAAEGAVERLDREYADAKRYMAQNRGELDPHEMFQNELALRDIDSSGAFAEGQRARLAQLQSSPYFARIDFREAGDERAEPYYIGRFSFRHENELLIFDWRAPVAGMFYDCETGPAAYTAPDGRVDGEITHKRQFKIQDGRLEYALESAASVRDDVLLRELARASDEGMRSIIATIQREQNRIIRSAQAGTLLIQGVAGSGKTSVAMHRVAFLLYRHKESLKAQNVAVLSPNRVFGDYISGVLPELGEEPVSQLCLADVTAVQLEGVVDFEPDKDPLEQEDAAWAGRVRFKSTMEFLERLEAYEECMPSEVFEARAYVFGEREIPAEWIAARFAAYAKHPVLERLEMIAGDIHERLAPLAERGEEPPRPKSILKVLKTMLKRKTTLAIYKDFYGWLGRPELFAQPKKGCLEWNDVFPFLHLHAAFAGVRESGVIRHLVVDEMQDYTPVQFAVLNRLFRCGKTILGDFGQRVDPNAAHTLEDLRRLYPGAEFVRLNKSYRSTWEITRFAGRIQGGPVPDALARHGEAPRVVRCEDRRGQLDAVREAIRAFVEDGCATVGVITKTNAAAGALHAALGDGGVHLVGPGDSRFAGGPCVLPVRMAKGLEFDAVILPDADSETYGPEDRGLLYVACTRALHRLALFYTGEPSSLLGTG